MVFLNGSESVQDFQSFVYIKCCNAVGDPIIKMAGLVVHHNGCHWLVRWLTVIIWHLLWRPVGNFGGIVKVFWIVSIAAYPLRTQYEGVRAKNDWFGIRV